MKMRRVYIELAVLFGCMVLSAIIAATFYYDCWSDLDIKQKTITASARSFYVFLIATPITYALSHPLRHVDYRL